MFVNYLYPLLIQMKRYHEKYQGECWISYHFRHRVKENLQNKNGMSEFEKNRYVACNVFGKKDYGSME